MNEEYITKSAAIEAACNAVEHYSVFSFLKQDADK